MRKILLLFVFTQIITVASAQVCISVNVSTPGGLSNTIRAAVGKLDSISNLTVTGTIDARDFKTMRDDMPLLTVVNLSNVSIETYEGVGGTADAGSLGNPVEIAALGGHLDGRGIIYPAKAIPKEAFSNHSSPKKNSRFTSIILPFSVNSIGGNAFYRCNGLTSITIPDSVTTISNNAFYDCSSLTSVTLSRQLTSIGEAAFSSCSSLTSITILRSLTSIGYGAFSGTNVFFTVDKNNANFTSIDGVLFNKSQTTLMQCPTSKKGTYSIPNTVTSIGVGVFQNCKDLSEVIIPNSVTSIGASAFYGCSGLISIVIPNSVTFIGAYAFRDCSGLTTINIPHSVTSISGGAFLGCSSLTTVTIPNSISSISQDVFADCVSLTSFTIPNSVTSISGGAFNGCKSLTSVTIPKSVTTIGWWAFSKCIALTTITIPSSLSDIGRYAFNGCSAMFSVEAGNATYSSVDGVLFNRKQNILIQCPTSKNGSYSIPNTVTSIANAAFVECSNLTSVLIPKKVNSIVPGSFSGCSAIISVDKKNRKYSSLDGILFDKKQKELLQYPISRTGSYTIPNSVISIGHSAFKKCEGLTSIIIPKSVKSIGVSSFNDCSGLISITVNSSLPVELSSFASIFYNVAKKTCTLYVPIGSKSLYQAANQWKDFENIVEVNYAEVH